MDRVFWGSVSGDVPDGMVFKPEGIKVMALWIRRVRLLT
jgi:hypothetical protein